MSIEKNIKARLVAEQIAELVDEEVKVHGVRVWEQLAKIAVNRVEVSKPRTASSKGNKGPMTVKEARAFGQTVRLPFGEFAGQLVDHVPLDRLRWYCEQTFVDDLRRYVASKRVFEEEE